MHNLYNVAFALLFVTCKSAFFFAFGATFAARHWHFFSFVTALLVASF